MLLQRVFTLLVLLIGVGLGILLGRFSAEVPEAEAAKRTTWRCILVWNQSNFVAIYNPTDRDITYTAETFDINGIAVGKPLYPRQQTLDTRQIAIEQHPHAGSMAISAAGPILVGAVGGSPGVSAIEHQSCFRGK